MLIYICMLFAILTNTAITLVDGEETFVITKDNPAAVIRAA